MEEASLAGVVDVGVVEVVGRTRVRGDRSCFLGLPLTRLELSVCPAIIYLYNIYKIENIRHMKSS